MLMMKSIINSSRSGPQLTFKKIAEVLKQSLRQLPSRRAGKEILLSIETQRKEANETRQVRVNGDLVLIGCLSIEMRKETGY